MSRFTVREIQHYERDVRLRMPFRFGVVTLTECPQAFVRVRIEDTRGRSSWGMSAELLAPKWFDKNLALSNEDNFEQLRNALRITTNLYLHHGRPETAFGLHAANYEQQFAVAQEQDLNRLVASFGQALIDRAVLDALCRLEQVSIYEAIRTNLPAIHPEILLPEFTGFDVGGWLAQRQPRSHIFARHTVGLVDPLTASDQNAENRVGDGLPETLEDVIRHYGQRYFKLKVAGDVQADLARLSDIAAVLDSIGEAYWVSLDGNEQYDDVSGVLELWRAMCKTSSLDQLVDAIMFIEQPLRRTHALSEDVSILDSERPVIIDESDDDLAAFPRARKLGYSGISAKSCKGFYKAVINSCRCARWNQEAGSKRFFMSAEDLTIQAGISLQQDLALAAIIGVEHIERNGHHYVNGMRALPGDEQQRFLEAHADLYEQSHGGVRVRIHDGVISMASLAGAGFASSAAPNWSDLRRLDLGE